MSTDLNEKQCVIVEDVEHFPGWESYPTNLENEGNTYTNYDVYVQQLSNLHSLIFCRDPNCINVDILDVSILPTGTIGVNRSKCTDSQALQDHMTSNEPLKTRFISISTTNSIRPLRINSDSMKKILTHHSISPRILDLLFSFGDKLRRSEAGLGGLTVEYQKNDAYNLQYLLPFAEEVASSPGDPKSYTLRQIGISHHYVPKRDGGVWIMLHSKPDSVAQQQFEKAASRWAGGSGTEWQDTPLMHLLVLSSYLSNWRWYLKCLSDAFEKPAVMALTWELNSTVDYACGFDCLAQLKKLENDVLPLAPRLLATLQTITALSSANDHFCERGYYGKADATTFSNALRAYESTIRGHIASVELLERRIRGILDMLAVALNLQNQITSTEINHNMLSLTKDTVDDSATVRVVTLVTLIYLPASFIAIKQSILGMNLFSFQSQEEGFIISPKFWIFIVLSMPLTIITVGSWFILAYHRKTRRQREREDRYIKGV